MFRQGAFAALIEIAQGRQFAFQFFQRGGQPPLPFFLRQLHDELITPARAVDGKPARADDCLPVCQGGGKAWARPFLPYLAGKGVKTLPFALLPAEPDAIQEIVAFLEREIDMPGGGPGKVCRFPPYPYEGKALLHCAAQSFGQFSYGKNIVHA